MPHKSGNVYVYDCPRSVALDYDLPPTQYTDRKDSQSNTFTSSLSGQLDVQTDYDVPSTADASGGRTGIRSNACGTLYDSPSSLLHSGQTWYDVPTCVGVDAEQVSLSNRSSVLSVISNDSRSSIASLRSGSSPSTSARSSAEVSLRDVYDTPRAAGEVGRLNAVVESSGKVSCSKLLGGTWAADRDSYLEDYSVPRNIAALSIASSSNTSISDTSSKGTSATTSKPTQSTEMQDFYDVPRNQQTEESFDYDTPAQSHSNSPASLSTYSLASGTRQLNESVGQPDVFHRQIVAKHDAILRSIERLTELAKMEIRGDAKHWCSLVTTTGLSLRTALKELLDLGKMAENHSDSVVAARLYLHCEPLYVMYASISQCLETLLAMSSKANAVRFGTQDLMNLTELVDRLHPLVNEFCVFLHSNAADICRLSADHKPSTAPASPVVGRRQAPGVKPKPNISHKIASTDVQLRPLPVPPTSENTSTQPAVGKGNTSWTYDDYDYIAISQEAESNSDQQAFTSRPALDNLRRSISTHPPPTDPIKRCAIMNGGMDQKVVLSTSDHDMITYYAVQINAHTVDVESAVSQFCQLTANDAVAPEVFVQMSKQVVLAGHKLVYIGDAIARHVNDDGVCNRVASAANVLCDCLKSVVVTTKEAVLALPSSSALPVRATDSAKSALAACKQLCNVIESYTGQS